MARLPVGTYLRFITNEGTPTGLYLQNFHAEETRTWDGNDYVFGNFAYSGSAVDASAASITGQLIFGVNALSMATFETVVSNRDFVEVRTVWLDPDTLDEGATWMTEVYAVTGMSNDLLRMSISLGSPLDAVTANFPYRVLTESMVGRLPISGNLTLR